MFVSTSIALLALTTSITAQTGRKGTAFVPKPGYFPPTGDDPVVAGGIFSISLTDLVNDAAFKTGMGAGKYAPKSVNEGGESTTGSGPYPAYMTTDPSLPEHTIYAPKDARSVKGKVPFIAWANGACGMDGAGYRNLLLEIASHGYVIAADGNPAPPHPPGTPAQTSGVGLGSMSSGGRQSTWQDMKNSIDWALAGGAGGKFGALDIDRIATAGHSCGGLSAMSNAYHNPAVKLSLLFNIAIFQDDRRYLLKELKSPVAWFIGGPKDMGYPNVSNSSFLFQVLWMKLICI
jgi:dienelactone hydrolase